MVNTISIKTRGGIDGKTDFKLFVNPQVTFKVEVNDRIVIFKCIEYKGKPNRQCYKCAFCHHVDMCFHMQCRGLGGKKLYKYIYVK